MCVEGGISLVDVRHVADGHSTDTFIRLGSHLQHHTNKKRGDAQH